MLGIYCRISKDRENQKSIDEQRIRGIAFADKINLGYNLYIDSGISGGGVKELRPGFDSLIKDVISGTITAIWIYNQDRTAREEATWFELANLIIDSNIDFYEDDKKVDLNDPNEFFTRGIRSSMDAYFKRITSVKIKDVLNRNIENGKAWGILPYGYKSDENKQLVIAEDEAEIIKQIFELSLSGIGTRTISERLNQLEIPTRYNKYGKGKITVKDRFDFREKEIKKSDIKWSPNTIRNIILNPIYKGERQWNKQTYKVDAILTADYWQKVNDNLKQNANNSGRVQQYEYLLKGLLQCGICGRNYYGRTRADKSDHAYICSSKRIKNYSCGNRGIGIDTLDSIVTLFLWSSSDLVKHLENHFNAIPATNEKELLTKRITTVRKDLNATNNDIQNLIQLSLKDIISDEDLSIQNDLLKSKQIKDNQTLKELEQELNNVSNSTAGLQSLIDKLNNLLESFNIDKKDTDIISFDIKQFDSIIDYSDKKAVIKEIVKNIQIYHDGVDTFYFQLNFNTYNTPPFTIAILDNFIKKKGVVYLDDDIMFLKLYEKNNRTYGIWFKRCFEKEFNYLKASL